MFHVVRLLAAVSVLSVASGVAAFAADPGSLSGAWQIRIASPQGARTPTMHIAQDGARLTGTYHSMRNGDVPLSGSVDGQQFVLKLRVTSGAEHLEMEYRGRFDGQSLAGVVVMGRRGETAFTATRLP